MSKEEQLEQRVDELEGKLDYLKDLSFEFIQKGGKVSNLNWGDGWDEWDIDKKLNYAMKLGTSYHDACMKIQDERDAFKKENELLKSKSINSDLNTEQQKDANIKAITLMNYQKQQMSNRIILLESKLKELGFNLKELDGGNS